MSTVDDRLLSAEQDINRILELLQESILVDEASKYAKIADDDAREILYRIKSIEEMIKAIKFESQITKKRG